MAIEAAELLGRPSCASCNEALRERRGCKRPGYTVDNDEVYYRFSSPRLQPTKREVAKGGEPGFILRECPTSYLLREADWTFTALGLLCLTESMTPLDAIKMPRFFRTLMAVHGTMREWIRKERKLQRDIKRQADAMARASNG